MAASPKDSPIHRAPEQTLSSAHITAVNNCLYAIENVIKTFLSLEISDIRCLPVFNFVRVAYSVVILLKIYFAASGPDSELGKALNKENMRVEHYLESLLEKFRLTAAEDKSRPAAKFLVVLAMLRTWFHKQGKHENHKIAAAKRRSASEIGGPSPGHTNSSGGTPRQSHSLPPLPKLPQTSTNTPLHLLSEAAASDTTRNANTGAPYTLFNSIPGLRQRPQPIFSESPSSDHSMTMGPPNLPASSNNNDPNAEGNADMPGVATSAFPAQPWGAEASTMPPNYYGMNSANLFSGFEVDAAILAGVPDGYEGNAGIVVQEPWFTDMFQGPLDPNMFQF